ncbi:MAG: hypothetical protein LBK53_01210, partial [Heliobacteriaceae bacterium]|nr:hypothetical protein [Heliobacteriaceae bacterium]
MDPIGLYIASLGLTDEAAKKKREELEKLTPDELSKLLANQKTFVEHSNRASVNTIFPVASCLDTSNTTGFEKKSLNSKFQFNPSLYSESEQTAMKFLNDMTSDANKNMFIQYEKDGAVAYAVNLWKECFNTEYAKSNVQRAISDTKEDIFMFEMAAKGLLDYTSYSGQPVSVTFAETFKKRRGVEFSEANIKDCEEKANVMVQVQSTTDLIKSLKDNLGASYANNVHNNTSRAGEKAVLNTLSVLGIKNKDEINEILKNVEEANKDNPLIKEYGGNFQVYKDEKGELGIYRTTKKGITVPITQEQTQLMLNELELRLNKTYAKALGIEYSENASSKDIEQMAEKKYNEYKSTYEAAFKKAYGGKDLKEMSLQYMNSQEKGVAYVDMGVNILTMVAMMVGGTGVLVKGAQMLGTGVKYANAITNACKLPGVQKFLMGFQITQPQALLETATGDQDFGAYGMRVGESAMWLALGMGSSIVGNEVRAFLTGRGLGKLVQASGKSVDELIALSRNGKLPADISNAFKSIDKAANLWGFGTELTTDILATYAIRGEDLSLMDGIMSLNGALIGGLAHKGFLAGQKEAELGAIRSQLKKAHPELSKADLDKMSSELFTLRGILHEKLKASDADVSKPNDTTTPKPEDAGVRRDTETITKPDDANPSRNTETKTTGEKMTPEEFREAKAELKKELEKNQLPKDEIDAILDCTNEKNIELAKIICQDK